MYLVEFFDCVYAAYDRCCANVSAHCQRPRASEQATAPLRPPLPSLCGLFLIESQGARIQTAVDNLAMRCACLVYFPASAGCDPATRCCRCGRLGQGGSLLAEGVSHRQWPTHPPPSRRAAQLGLICSPATGHATALPKISHRRSLVNAKQHREDGAMAHA